jgi:hypothetical protein
MSDEEAILDEARESVIFAAPFLGVWYFVAGRMLFYLHMPISGVVMHRRVHLGAKQQDRR